MDSQCIEEHRCWYSKWYMNDIDVYRSVHQPIMWMKLNIANICFTMLVLLMSVAIVAASLAYLASLSANFNVENFLFNCILCTTYNFVRVLESATYFSLRIDQTYWTTIFCSARRCNSSSWHPFIFYYNSILFLQMKIYKSLG